VSITFRIVDETSKMKPQHPATKKRSLKEKGHNIIPKQKNLPLEISVYNHRAEIRKNTDIMKKKVVEACNLVLMKQTPKLLECLHLPLSMVPSSFQGMKIDLRPGKPLLIDPNFREIEEQIAQDQKERRADLRMLKRLNKCL